MATREQLEAALMNASAAADRGDPDAADAARALAAELKKMRSQQAKPATAADLMPGVSIDPTEGMSGGQRFAAGAGKAVADTPSGARQLLTEMAAFIAPKYGQPLMQEEVGRLRGQADATAAQDAPLMATPGGFWGNVAGQGAQLAAAPGSAPTLAGKLGLAGIQGAGYSAMQPVGIEGSRTEKAVVGGGLGALGQGVASGLGVLAGGAKAQLDPIARGFADKAEQIGMRLGVGQLSDNPQIRNIVSQMERLPFSGARARAESNQQAFNSAVGAEFGAAKPKITPEVFAQAKGDISDVFETLVGRNDLKPTPELMAQLSAIAQDASRKGTSDSARMVTGYINDLVRRAGPDGSIPGRAYQALDSEIGKTLKNGGDPALYLGRVRDAVRAAMDDSISPADKAAWQTARQQWAAMKTVEPLVAKSAKGNISAPELMNRVTADKAGKARMAVGRGGELGELARVGQNFLKAAPDSGTADRLAVNLGVLGTIGGAQHYGVISPQTAGWLGALLTGNRMALKALSSKTLIAGESKALNGLARLAQTAQPGRALPAAAAASAAAVPMEIDVVGGRRATPENDPYGYFR